MPIFRGMRRKGWTADGALLSGIGEAAEHYTFAFRKAVHLDSSLNTNGWAAHSRVAKAEASAIRELVERDAFLEAWITRNFGCALDVSIVEDRRTRALAESLLKIGFNLKLVLLPAKMGLPVVLALLWHDDPMLNLPHSVCGVACGDDLEVACQSSIMEAAQMVPAVRFHARRGDVRPDDVATPDGHARFYGTSFRWDLLKDVLQLPASPNLHFFPTARTGNIKAFCHEVTPADINASGIHVLAARDPNLRPLTFGLGEDLHTIHPLC